MALDPANFEPGGVLEGLNVTTGNGGEGTTVDLINPAGVVVVNFGVSAPPGSRDISVGPDRARPRDARDSRLAGPAQRPH